MMWFFLLASIVILGFSLPLIYDIINAVIGSYSQTETVFILTIAIPLVVGLLIWYNLKE